MNDEEKNELCDALTTSIAGLVTTAMGAIKDDESGQQVLSIIHHSLIVNLAALSNFSSTPPKEFSAHCGQHVLDVIESTGMLSTEEETQRLVEDMLKDILNNRGN